MHSRHQRLLRALPALFVLSCGGGGSDGGPADVPVIVLSQSALSLTEGTPETLTVVLDAAPQANVSVALGSAGRVTVLPTTLDFTPANFSTPKSVIVLPLQDADLAAGTDTVTATATGLGTVKLPVTIADNDSQAVVLDSSHIALVEGDSATYGVRLAYQPLAPVNVTLTPSDTQVAVTPTTLNFTPADYATPKTVKVRARQDVDLHPDTVQVVASVPSGQQASLPVDVLDDDVQAIVVDSASLAMAEGDSGVISVHLAFRASGSTTVLVASMNTGVATVSPPSLTFSPFDYGTSQNVRVHATHDNDLVAGATALGLSAPGIPVVLVGVAVADVDTQAVLVGTDSLTILEGDTASFTVRLAYQPAGDVTVDFGPLDTNVTVSQSAAIFTPANYDTPIRVTVTAHHDTDLGDEATFVTAGIASGPTSVVNITVDDDDVQAFVTSVDTVFVTEGLDATVSITLAFQPLGDVTVLLSTDGLVATVSPTSFLSLTPANYATGFTAVIHGTEDANTTTDGTLLTIQASGVPQRSILVIVADND